MKALSARINASKKQKNVVNTTSTLMTWDLALLDSITEVVTARQICALQASEET